MVTRPRARARRCSVLDRIYDCAMTDRSSAFRRRAEGRADRSRRAEKAAPMRARQLWNWIYVHGARDFARDDQSREGFSRAAWPSASRWRGPRSSPSRSPPTAPANGCCARGPGIEFETVFIPEPGRGTLCVSSPGRLHAQLPLLPHRHAEARAQSDARRDRGPGDGGARRAGRLAVHGARTAASPMS